MLDFDVISTFYGRLKYKGHNVYVNNHLIEYNACRRNLSGFWFIFTIDVRDVKRPITYPNVTN